MPDEKLIASASNTLELEAKGITALAKALDGELGEEFVKAVEAISKAQQNNGRVIISGMGKSGHIGQKVAATLASTGTPAFFVHPSEAGHGDLGMITANDAVIGFSWSGETVELSALINYTRRFNVSLISVTSKADSALALASDVKLILPRSDEACPHGLAPTTSTTMQLAIGDALAIALLEYKGFSASDFKVFHPGGSLGASLSYVRDLMHKKEALPLVGADLLMSEALVVMTEKSFGCLGIEGENGELQGIITDGDLRRHMSAGLVDMKAGDVMTTNPKTVPSDLLASKALEIINSLNITTLFVVDDDKPVGILHLHDLLRAKIA
jgi:arabinose-5-phosphate isomerase